MTRWQAQNWKRHIVRLVKQHIPFPLESQFVKLGRPLGLPCVGAAGWPGTRRT